MHGIQLEMASAGKAFLKDAFDDCVRRFLEISHQPLIFHVVDKDDTLATVPWEFE